MGELMYLVPSPVSAPPPRRGGRGLAFSPAHLPRLVELSWRTRIDEVLKSDGGLSALHAERDTVLADYEVLAAALEEQSGTDPSLVASAETLRTFLADLTRRWVTELDLEEIICRAITPPAGELRKKLEGREPPAWWLEEIQRPW